MLKLDCMPIELKRTIFIPMKNSIYILVFLFMGSFMSCQSVAKGQTPKAVKKAFKEKYPGENDPDWKLDKNGNYESHFKKKGNHYRADFSPNGKWIETEQSIKTKKLPKVILDILAKTYWRYEVVEVEKVQHYAKGLFYDVELIKDGKKMDVEFTKEGKILN